MLVSAYDAYVLVDTSAMHAYISDQFMFACGLIPEVLIDCVLSVNTPLGGGSVLTSICRDVDVVIAGIHMTVDLLVLPISDFDVVLGMN